MRRRASVSGAIFDGFNSLFMLLVFCVMMYPFLYVLNYSISASAKVGGSALFLPVGVNFDNYRILLKDSTIYRAFFVSLSRCLVGPAAMIVVSGMAGYVLSKKDLVFGKFFRWAIFFTMYFGAGLIPQYLLMKNVGLTNTYLVYIVPGMVSAFNIILIRTYIENLPISVEEAALIDGCNEFQVYWRVLFPICLPVNAAVILFSAIGHWNDFMTTQLYNAMKPALYTMQYVLYNALAVQLQQTLEEAKRSFSENVVTGQSLKMAITVITIIPIMCAYPFLQRYFVSGLLVGSIKA